MYSPLLFDIKNTQKWLFLEEAHENSHLSCLHTPHWFIQPTFLHTSSEPSPLHTNMTVLLILCKTLFPTLISAPCPSPTTAFPPSSKVTWAEMPCHWDVRAPCNPSTLYLVTLENFSAEHVSLTYFLNCLPPFGRRNSTRLGILVCFLW